MHEAKTYHANQLNLCAYVPLLTFNNNLHHLKGGLGLRRIDLLMYTLVCKDGNSILTAFNQYRLLIEQDGKGHFMVFFYL